MEIATLATIGALVTVGVLLASFMAIPVGAQKGDEAGLAAITRTGAAITAVKVVTETNAQSTNSTTFVDVPGASTTISIPRNTSRLIMARFSAESECSGAVGYCPVRILIDGAEGNPASGSDFAFDSTNSGNETGASWESHSMDRMRKVDAGSSNRNVNVRVQWAVTDPSITLRLDDWALTVERAN